MVKGIAEKITDEDELAWARKAPAAVGAHGQDPVRARHAHDRHQRPSPCLDLSPSRTDVAVTILGFADEVDDDFVAQLT